MDSTAVKDRLHDRMMDLDGEQFEQFSKIVVEEIEEPPHIELTPFGGDGGIDIRGRYGRSFFDAQFGVQVKRYERNVGSPAMRDFVGALTQHDYDFGSFITTANFSNGAKKAAEQQEIVLIDGDRLSNIMIVNEIGVCFDDSDYLIDESFWNIFDETEQDDLVGTDEVPQADSFDIIHTTLLAIDEGYRFNPEIRDYLEANTEKNEWTRRQADYYPSAAYILGFVHQDRYGEYEGREMRRWGLTREGREYIELVRSRSRKESNKYLNQQIRESEIIRRILDRIEKETSISHGDLGDIIAEESELSGSTPARRRGTVSNWLSQLPEVSKVRDGHSYRYDYLSSNLSDYTS